MSNLYHLSCEDGASGLMSLPEKSVKLVYGSPPYPNSKRDYGTWKADEYLKRIAPFIDGAKHALQDDGFLVINAKANREKTAKASSHRSLIVEKLAVMLEETYGLYCVDIEIWVKGNPVPTGLRCACQDAYEQILWFSVSPRWEINIDAIRRPYDQRTFAKYEGYEYKPRGNGLTYVRKNKKFTVNPLGALPLNVISGAVSSARGIHQAVQPLYLPEKYIKAVTSPGDIVADPWVGSGTTGVAALSLGRRFVGFDVFQEYVDIARERLEAVRTA